MGEWTLPTLAVLLVAYAAVSLRVQTSPISQAMVFVAVGLLVGNRVLDLVDADVAGQFVRHLAEATLTLMLFTDAVRINLPRLRRESRVPARLLGVGLPLTIVAGTVTALLLFPDLGLWTAAALATILAPTDAALGQPVVSNQRLPSRIRQGLNVESGLNDGICVPLLIIFLTLAEADEHAGDLDPVRVVLEEIGFGAVAGIAAGCFGCLRAHGVRGPRMDVPDLAADQRLRDPAAGLHAGGRARRQRLHRGVRRRDRLRGGRVASGPSPRRCSPSSPARCSTRVTFLMFGAVLLGPALADLDWRVAAYAVLSLTVVRMLPVALAALGMGLQPPHGGLPRLVRSARARLHRVRAAARRGFDPRGDAADDDRRDGDGRAVRPRPRSHRVAGSEPLRRLVRRAARRPRVHAREQAGAHAATPGSPHALASAA